MFPVFFCSSIVSTATIFPGQMSGEARRSVANRKSYDLGRDDEGDFDHWDMLLEFLNMLRSMMH